jgi:hypothetical protein
MNKEGKSFKYQWATGSDLVYWRNKPQNPLRVFVPADSELRRQLMRENHDQCGHLGAQRVAERLARRYYWTGMHNYYIRNMVSYWHKRQLNKSLPLPLGVPDTALLLDWYGTTGSMYNDIRGMVSACQKCQINKPLPYTSGEMIPISLPTRKGEQYTMDFIVSLPQTDKGHDSIWVIVDRLNKMGWLIPTTMDITAPGLVRPFFETCHITRTRYTPHYYF